MTSTSTTPPPGQMGWSTILPISSARTGHGLLEGVGPLLLVGVQWGTVEGVPLHQGGGLLHHLGDMARERSPKRQNLDQNLLLHVN